MKEIVLAFVRRAIRQYRGKPVTLWRYDGFLSERNRERILCLRADFDAKIRGHELQIQVGESMWTISFLEDRAVIDRTSNFANKCNNTELTEDSFCPVCTHYHMDDRPVMKQRPRTPEQIKEWWLERAKHVAPKDDIPKMNKTTFVDDLEK